ncbi:MAG: DsrE family protein [Promethearchaeota archaeon]|jgi:sulfur relay (sulfurtransferase) DsrF/TusC family protein
MVNKIVIICEDSPFGKNSVVESIRMATGILAVGDLEDCKVVLLKDAVYFLNKNLNPEALGVDQFTNIMRLIDLSDLEIFIHDEALNNAGLTATDLLPIETLKIASLEEISQIISNADMSFKY